ncbi:hypothetical protein CLV27_1036 [Phorcysia thermohydrogeniphila]|uniref:Uncharacterized protein n=1 Tax=Phorcysia thermohydrogeniphila TaxID=936138 RepID=A0A4R1GCR6_9BACT|nr:hypothetical protein CLV27_1036 [Phorcysia thermohydrogeniphila]
MDIEFEWDSKKDEFLRKERGISFEEIIELITPENLLAVREHPNPLKYPNQKIFIININGYAWVATYPSRKWTKVYLRR